MKQVEFRRCATQEVGSEKVSIVVSVPLLGGCFVLEVEGKQTHDE